MVKLLFFCRRRPDLTHERYATLLLDGHVPLALRHHPSMRRYVVNIVEQSLADAPPLDSIGALWFDTLADYQERLYDSPEGERIIARDVARFMGGADAYVTDEHVVRPPPAPTRSAGEKLVVGFRRLPELTRAGFVERWLAAPPLAVRASIANLIVERRGAAPPDYDGIAELYLEASPAGPTPGAIREAFSPLATVDIYRVAEYVQR